MGFILRILLLAAAIWLLWRLWTKVRAQLASDTRPAAPPPPQFEPMAQCAGCGTHLPAQSLSADGRCGRCIGRG